MRRMIGVLALVLVVSGGIWATPVEADVATFNIQAETIPANTLVQTRNVRAVSRFTVGTIQLVDTNNQWSTATGTIVQWGFMFSENNGQTWQWGPIYQTDLPFGSRDRSGGMPALKIESADLAGMRANTRLLLGIITAPGSQTITLGATVTVE